MFPSEFETERLRFERLCAENLPAREFYEFCKAGRAGVEAETAYVPWDPVQTVGEAAERLREFEAAWESRERAEWFITPKRGENRGERVAGTTGLICRWEQDLVLPALWLRTSYWGREYSGERADALLHLAFDRLDVGVVAVVLHAENRKSYRAVGKYVERHGGRYEGILRNHGGRYDAPVDHHRFTISRDEYERANGTEATVSMP